jgi:hypothetical protein
MLKKYARKVKCLGWCGKEFLSQNPVYFRICPKCKVRYNKAADTRSFAKYEKERE